MICFSNLPLAWLFETNFLVPRYNFQHHSLHVNIILAISISMLCKWIEVSQFISCKVLWLALFEWSILPKSSTMIKDLQNFIWQGAGYLRNWFQKGLSLREPYCPTGMNFESCIGVRSSPLHCMLCRFVLSLFWFSSSWISFKSTTSNVAASHFWTTSGLSLSSYIRILMFILADNMDILGWT